MTELDHIVSKSLAAARGDYGVLSQGERLAAALVLNRPDWILEEGYTLSRCIERVGADWMRLIPEAARRVAAILLESAEALDKARVAAAIASMNGQAREQDQTVDFNATLTTHSNAPGYRDVSLVFELHQYRTNATMKAELFIKRKDAQRIFLHIRDVHRFAWRNDAPIDKEPGETASAWAR